MIQSVISQGFEFKVELTVPDAGDSATWKVALFCPSTNERYVANDPETLSEQGVGVFVFPSGLGADLKPDPEIKNGTANMKKGIYRLEVFKSDRSGIGVVEEFARVESSNLMASNIQ